jgi:Zn-dependent membrane protease YugP
VQASIKVTFDSKGKTGKQNKRVTLMTNAIPNVKILTIKGEVSTN